MCDLQAEGLGNLMAEQMETKGKLKEEKGPSIY